MKPLIALALFPLCALADTSRTETVILPHPADPQHLHRLIVAAAERVCAQPEEDPYGRSRERVCVERAVREAVARMNGEKAVSVAAQ